MSSGTLYADLSNGWSFTGSHTATVQVVVNGVAVGGTITYSASNGASGGVLHVAETGLGISPGSRVEVVVVTNSSSLGEVSWTLGP
jgi:hypothetical protein